MGCGPSRSSKRPGLTLPTDCSGSYCNKTISDVSGIPVFDLFSRELEYRIVAEIALMDVPTLNSFKTIAGPSVILAPTTNIGRTYTSIMTFINDNGANITDEQVKLMKDAAMIETSPIVMNFMLMLAYYQTSTAIPANVSTWYNRYVEMLYQAVIKTPAYTPTQLNAAVTLWLATNPSPGISVSGFTNQSSSLENIINNVKNNKISGFTDFKPYDGAFEKHRFNNGYHSV